MRMKASVLLAVLGVLLLGGLLYAGAQVLALRTSKTFICPLTGQPLPCPKCCPLNKKSA